MKSVFFHRQGPVRALFLGRDESFEGDFDAALLAASRRLGFTPPRDVAALRQVHSARAVEALARERAEADALLTREPGLALAVVTADCVPVLFAGQGTVAAVHAGWRGLATKVVAATASHDLAPPDGFSTAWIGPCMAACCYEVGSEVATRVALASGTGVIHERAPSVRPHLALESAAHAQLEACGLEDVRLSRTCTGCHESWWSYRRLGARAGRNLAFVWLVDR